jgi:membrane protein
MPVKRLKPILSVLWRTVQLFNATDGWAIASHVALSALMALFPFLIFLTAVAAFFDLRSLSETVVTLIFESVPAVIAGPISAEVRNVLTVPRGDLLTVGVALAVWFASSGVEALRVGLNRAYGAVETRHFLWLRLESVVFVLIGTLVLLTLAFFVVFAPVAWKAFRHFLPHVAIPNESLLPLRFLVTALVAGGGLTFAHLWLPAGRRSLLDVLPGVVVTIAAWIAGGVGFSVYLVDFANYASTYAGLAGVMTAIIFLYLIALILLLGATLNASILERRRPRMAEPPAVMAD